MLVLSRKPGERIVIDRDIKITVLRIGPRGVRIGIEAPGGISIVREELLLAAAEFPEHTEVLPAQLAAANG